MRPTCVRAALLGAILLSVDTLSAADDPKAEEAKKAQAVLKANCYRCHGEAGAVEGGFNYVADLDRLVSRKKVVPGKADQSPVYKRIANGTMPPPDAPVKLSDADKAAIKKWIDDGAHIVQPAAPRKFLTQAEVDQTVLADLEKLDRRSRRFVRYFSFVHLWNAGLSEEELQTYRNSLNKVVNSLSWHPKVRNPVAIDPAGVILRIDLRWYMWDATVWNRILNDYPYGILDDSTPARAIMVSTLTKVPLMRGDWFVATASRPPLYQDILQLPGNLADLERQLRVDSALNVTQERVIRLAFNGSGISKNNRILERHDAVHGYYWRTYDFEEVPQNLIDRGQLLPDRRNVFACPLGPGNLENNFQHAGGEAIFALPNGLQGYYIMNAVNNRLDKAPTAIVSDPKRPDRAVELGVSCMGCHISGILSKADQMHDFLVNNPKAISRADADIAKALYPAKEVSLAAMEEDAKRYAAAVAQTGAKIAKAEPVITMTVRYEADVDVISAAAEVGLTLEDFQKRIGESSLLSRNLGALRVPGGTVGRQVWVQAFGDVVKELKVGVLFQANQVGAALPDNTGELDPLEVATGQANGMAFSADGRLAIIASADRSVQSYEVEGRRVLKRFVGHTASVWSVALSGDNKLALSGSMDGSVRLWRVEDGQQIHKLDGHNSLVTSVAFTPNGKWAVSGGFDGAVIYWNLSTGRESKRYEGPMKYINALAVSPDGKKVLIAADKWVRVWDIDTGAEVGKFEGHTGAVTAISFSTDGKKALSGSDDKTVRLWDMATGKQEQLFTGHEGAIRAVAFNDKGNWMLSGGSDSSVRLWKTATAELLGKFAKHSEPVVQVAFLNNGTQTLSGSRDNQLLPWSIEKFQPAPKVEKKDPPTELNLKPLAKVPVDGNVAALLLTPNRKWLLYLDVTNGTVGQIDAATGQQKKSLSVEGDLMALSPDGKTLFVAGKTAAGKGTLVAIDPVALTVRKSVSLELAPFSLSPASENAAYVSGGGEGWTSVGLVDVTAGSTKYLAPVMGKTHIHWLPGALLAHADSAGTKLVERLALPVDEKKKPNWTGYDLTEAFAGPSVMSPDGRQLINRSGSILTSDGKPVKKIGPWLGMAIDADAAVAFVLSETGWLKRFSYPAWEETAKWKLPLTAYQLSADAKGGKLYMSVIDPAAIRDRPRAKGYGDIWTLNLNELKTAP